MTPDKEHAPALMQQAADEAAARAVERAEHPEWTDAQFDTWWNRDPFFCEKVTAWTSFRGTRKAHAIWKAGIALRCAPTYEQGVAAGLEMAAKVAEGEPAGSLGEWTARFRRELVGMRLGCDWHPTESEYGRGREHAASAIRALADQHKPSPAEEPMP